MPPAEADRWVIVLRDAGGSEVQVGRRVAAMLKRCLRDWRLRCIEASERTPDEQLAAARDEILELRRRLERAERPRRHKAALS